MVQSVNILPVIWFKGFQRLWQKFPISEFFWEKLIDWLCIWLHPVNDHATYNKVNLSFRVGIMVVWVFEFSSGGYKIGKIFTYKSTYPKKSIEFWEFVYYGRVSKLDIHPPPPTTHPENATTRVTIAGRHIKYEKV